MQTSLQQQQAAVRGAIKALGGGSQTISLDEWNAMQTVYDGSAPDDTPPPSAATVAPVALGVLCKILPALMAETCPNGVAGI